MAKQIPLTKGKFSIVDDADFEWLSQWKWHYGTNGYAVRTENYYDLDGTRKCRKIGMHRHILGINGDLCGDHKDGNTLNNQRYNLRVATSSQNQMNRIFPRSSSSQYKGVSWSKAREKWKVSIVKLGKRKHLGYFNSEQDAALVYNFAAHNNFGEFAAFNVAGG